MNTSNDVDLLLTVPPFTVLDPPELKRLAEVSERLRYAPGEVLVRQGEAGDAVYVVLEGSAEVTVNTDDGPRVVRKLVRHAFVGEVALLAQVARTATVRATTEVVALKIERAELLRLIQDMPILADSIAAHKDRSDYIYE